MADEGVEDERMAEERNEGLEESDTPKEEVEESGDAGSDRKSLEDVLEESDIALLDIDGTLVDRRDVFYAFYKEIADELGVDIPDTDTLASKYANATHEETLNNLFGISADQVKSYLSRLENNPEKYSGFNKENIRVLEGTLEMIRYLRGLGKKIGVVTNASWKEAKINLEKILGQYNSRYSEKDGTAYRLSDVADFVSSKANAETKPSPDGVIKSIGALKAGKAYRVFLFGDEIKDVQAARNAGIVSIASAYSDSNIMSSNPDYTVKNTLQLSSVVKGIYKAG